jgi:hypothetical protein
MLDHHNAIKYQYEIIFIQQIALNDNCLRRVMCLGVYGYSFKFSSGSGRLLEDPSIHEFSQNAPEMHPISENDAWRDLSESVRTISARVISDETSARVIQDWREVGRLVDRILGCACFVTTLILLLWSVRIWSGWCNINRTFHQLRTNDIQFEHSIYIFVALRLWPLLACYSNCLWSIITCTFICMCMYVPISLCPLLIYLKVNL